MITIVDFVASNEVLKKQSFFVKKIGKVNFLVLDPNRNNWQTVKVEVYQNTSRTGPNKESITISKTFLIQSQPTGHWTCPCEIYKAVSLKPTIR
jgi:hypothetical protein